MTDSPTNILLFINPHRLRTSLLTMLLTSLLLVSFTTIASNVYKWTDKDGNVHYSAKPESSTAQPFRINVAPPPSSNDVLDKAASGIASQPDIASPSGNQSTTENNQAEVDANNTEIRKKNCDVIKKRLATIQRGGRLYELDDQGERHYWDDKTRLSKLDQTQSDLKKWCR
ncbi:MAG: DUF4124 domain-containing protein [Gammaproteobacteria bacterium]|nr:DUF4124 domain-containing protein [Gammaproteobacteria bacterium]